MNDIESKLMFVSSVECNLSMTNKLNKSNFLKKTLLEIAKCEINFPQDTFVPNTEGILE